MLLDCHTVIAPYINKSTKNTSANNTSANHIAKIYPNPATDYVNFETAIIPHKRCCELLDINILKSYRFLL